MTGDIAVITVTGPTERFGHRLLPPWAGGIVFAAWAAALAAAASSAPVGATSSDQRRGGYTAGAQRAV